MCLRERAIVTLSSNSIQFDGTLDATVKLSKLSDAGYDLTGSLVTLEVTAPATVSDPTPVAVVLSVNLFQA